MSNAPYCPISTNQPQGPKRQPAGVDVTTIPPVHNLREVITVLNQMNNIVQSITRGVPQINNVYVTGETQVSVKQELPPAPQYERVTWDESGRGYRDGKVVNPDDTSQYVELKVLSHISWTESVTGHQLRYKGQGD